MILVHYNIGYNAIVVLILATIASVSTLTTNWGGVIDRR